MNENGWVTYSKNREGQHQHGLKLLSLWNDDWENEDIVLDIGCGTGELTKMIAERDSVKSVIGIDISANAIKYARQNNTVGGKTQYLVADALCFPETFSHFEKAFTKVFCNSALQWMDDKQKVFQNVSWCLKENGLFVVHVLRGEDPFSDVYHKALELPKWKNYLKDFQPTYCPFWGSLEDLTNMISKCDFKKYPRTLKPYSFVHSPATNEDHKAIIKPLMTHLDYIPRKLHEDFMEDCLKISVQASADTDDGVPIWHFDAINVKLKK
ncbi:malonyl-[acyl-carrier protein] O-methyltransferase 2-like isoform X1 [Ptychodera flava]|uniref:malonyl-[acyl-carrier protein] O-methyltransferase 2-like isoform X1 n=1 Tax=Ptychodera flava TaxID=63121 RepID=UPI00396A229C